MHIDIQVEDIEQAERQVLELGARQLPKREVDADNPFRVYVDPAGHPFCLEF